MNSIFKIHDFISSLSLADVLTLSSLSSSIRDIIFKYITIDNTSFKSSTMVIPRQILTTSYPLNTLKITILNVEYHYIPCVNNPFINIEHSLTEYSAINEIIVTVIEDDKKKTILSRSVTYRIEGYDSSRCVITLDKIDEDYYRGTIDERPSSSHPIRQSGLGYGSTDDIRIVHYFRMIEEHELNNVVRVEIHREVTCICTSRTSIALYSSIDEDEMLQSSSYEDRIMKEALLRVREIQQHQ